jgi:hypothetical protein
MIRMSLKLDTNSYLIVQSNTSKMTPGGVNGLFNRLMYKTGKNYLKTKQILRDQYGLFVTIDNKPWEV